jgi:hypothetical protein
MSAGRKTGMSALRLYLAVAMILAIIKIIRLAITNCSSPGSSGGAAGAAVRQASAPAPGG